MGSLGTDGFGIPPSPHAPFSQDNLGSFRSKMASVGVLVALDGVRSPRGMGRSRASAPLHLLAVLRSRSVRRMDRRLHLLVGAARLRLGSTRSQRGRQERGSNEPTEGRCESKFHNCKLEVGMQKVKPSGAAFKQRAVYF